jgi:Protein of unknown function (DUF664)
MTSATNRRRGFSAGSDLPSTRKRSGVECDAPGRAGLLAYAREEMVNRAGSWWNRGVDVASLLLDIYGRIPPLARHAVEGVHPGRLTQQPSPGANTIAWLVWHLTRVQDHHIAELIDADQVWVADNWARRFGLEADPSNTGYGHSAEEMAAVRPEQPGVLLEYLDVVDARTRAMLAGLAPGDLDRVVDRRWDPPVTMGVRLISVADDSLQHVGQAGYVRGLLGA